MRRALTLEAGRCIVKDGVPFVTLHGVGDYSPTEADAFAREVVEKLNAYETLMHDYGDVVDQMQRAIASMKAVGAVEKIEKYDIMVAALKTIGVVVEQSREDPECGLRSIAAVVNGALCKLMEPYDPMVRVKIITRELKKRK